MNNILKFKFLEFLNTLDDHFFQSLTFFVTLKDDPVTIQKFSFSNKNLPILNFNQ